MFSNSVLAIILGGGQGSRLFPLTEKRSKPAVPIAGKYRLVDIPISNCINSDIKRMYVLTQFNSASLNRHIKNTYHFSFFSKAFVDVLAAELTMTSGDWFKGTADIRLSCNILNAMVRSPRHGNGARADVRDSERIGVSAPRQ